MPVRKADAEWNGSIREGSGRIKTESGALDTQYSFAARFESGTGTNPEELIAAAHAGCFSMALSAALGRSGFNPARIHTTAAVRLDKVGDGFGITRIELECEGEVPDIDQATFQEHANGAKANCPISKALAGTEITLKAKLK